MPITRSAIKKRRSDRKKEIFNEKIKNELKNSIKKAEKEKKPEFIIQAISHIDKAVKKNIYHKNKAARLKSMLSKLITITSEEKKSKKLKKVKKVKTSSPKAITPK